MATWLSSRDLKDHPSDAQIRKALPVGDVQAIDDTRREIRWVISDGSVDRDNDTINPQGWDLTAYKQNPVVLWAHDPRQLPVAKATAIGVENGALVAEAEAHLSHQEYFEWNDHRECSFSTSATALFIDPRTIFLDL